MQKIGFIGGGNMAAAIMGGIIGSGARAPSDVIVSDVNAASLKALGEKFGVGIARGNCEVAREAGLIVLAVKPQFYREVIEEIRADVLADGQKIVLTLPPGWTLARVEQAFSGPLKIVRTMPNTPALVGEGLTAACPNELVTDDEMERVLALLGSFGRAQILPERLFDVFAALCGSSPAFVFMVIEAMCDAAVREGMPRAQAYTLAAQAVLGSAKMVLELGQHPGALKDMVCSPGGSTIEGVRALEAGGMRTAFFEAIARSVAKNREI